MPEAQVLSDMQLTKETVRKCAIKLLDDKDGISFEAMELLSTILVESGNEDFLEHIIITDDDTRAFIHEDVAELELGKLPG